MGEATGFPIDTRGSFDTGTDLYAVINRATDRVGRVVVKYLDRSRIDRRHGADALALQRVEVDSALHSHSMVIYVGDVDVLRPEKF